MMTLDEAIEHCEQNACCNTECVADHQQLKEWLLELKEKREIQKNNLNAKNEKPYLIENGERIFNPKSAQWIDLGLPSGNLWAKTAIGDFYSFEDATKIYRQYLPNISAFEELREYCQWEWNRDDGERFGRFIVIGPNGNSIYLYALGIEVDHVVDSVRGALKNYKYAYVGSIGRYWFLNNTKMCAGDLYFNCDEPEKIKIFDNDIEQMFKFSVIPTIRKEK